MTFLFPQAVTIRLICTTSIRTRTSTQIVNTRVLNANKWFLVDGSLNNTYYRYFHLKFNELKVSETLIFWWKFKISFTYVSIFIQFFLFVAIDDHQWSQSKLSLTSFQPRIPRLTAVYWLLPHPPKHTIGCQEKLPH